MRLDLPRHAATARQPSQTDLPQVAPLLDVGQVHERSAAGSGASCCGARARQACGRRGAAAALHSAVLACRARPGIIGLVWKAEQAGGRQTGRGRRANTSRHTSRHAPASTTPTSLSTCDCHSRCSPLMALLLGRAVPADGRPLLVPSRPDASRCGAPTGRPRLLGPAGAAGRAGRAAAPLRPVGPLPVSMLLLGMAPAEQPGVSPDFSCVSMSCHRQDSSGALVVRRVSTQILLRAVQPSQGRQARATQQQRQHSKTTASARQTVATPLAFQAQAKQVNLTTTEPPQCNQVEPHLQVLVLHALQVQTHVIIPQLALQPLHLSAEAGACRGRRARGWLSRDRYGAKGCMSGKRPLGHALCVSAAGSCQLCCTTNWQQQEREMAKHAPKEGLMMCRNTSCPASGMGCRVATTHCSNAKRRGSQRQPGHRHQ